MFELIKKNAPYLIAEIGVNHEGNVQIAENIIRDVSQTGVSAVKLQSYTPSRFISSSDEARFERVCSFQLSLEEHIYLANIAKKLKLDFISTAVSEDWVNPLAEICDALKIASGDINFTPTLELAAQSNLPVILSTGASDIYEVDNAVNLFKSFRSTEELRKNFALMHCVSDYPAKLEECNLNSIPFMANRFDLEVGWSNHTLDDTACVVATSLGARLIEVHVTDQKSDRAFRDHQLSFEPSELEALVNKITKCSASLGQHSKSPTSSEIINQNSMRKGLVFSKNLKSGHQIGYMDLLFARPVGDFSFNDLESLIGKKLVTNVIRGQIVEKTMF